MARHAGTERLPAELANRPFAKRSASTGGGHHRPGRRRPATQNGGWECCFRVGAGVLAEARDAFELDDLYASRGTEGVLLLRLSEASVIRVMAQTLESRPRRQRLRPRSRYTPGQPVE
jgi:hypothetical protein